MGSDFKNTTNVADYELWALAHRDKEPSKTPRFITLSAGAHLLAISLIAVLATPFVTDIKPDIVTIEIEDVREPMPIVTSQGLDVPETRGSQASAAPVITEKLAAEDVIAPAPVEALPPKAAPAVKTAKSAPKAAPAAAPAKAAAVAKTNFQAVPATIDDIEAPELEAGDFAKTPVAAADLGEELNKDFSSADSKYADELAQEKQQLDKLTAAMAAEASDGLNSLEERNSDEEARLLQAQEDLKARNAQAVASALAAENAAAEAAAKERAARLAAQKEAAAKAASLTSGEGMGNNGVNKKAAAIAGAPQGVRSLDQLRQMPGNPRPQYSREERHRGDQGEVAFLAYISSEGYPTQFKMLKSTGLRNLDSKTLVALKQWRFYPGQEGWVELPFRWDLKGGVQEDGGLLRREAVSSR